MPEKESASSQNPVVSKPQFLICFLDYVNLSLVFSLPYETNALPSEHRHFGDDINFAVSGQRSIPKIRNLRWPMVQSAHIQQTEEDARQVVRQKLLQSHSRLFVFGRLALGYISESPAGRDIGDSIEIGGKHLLILEDVKHYFENPLDKRGLWRFIREVLTR